MEAHLGRMTLSDQLLSFPADPLQLGRSLEPDLLAGVLALREWLVMEGSRLDDPREVFTGFIENLRSVGAEVEWMADE